MTRYSPHMEGEQRLVVGDFGDSNRIQKTKPQNLLVLGCYYVTLGESATGGWYDLSVS